MHEELHRALLRLREDGPEHHDLGICHNLHGDFMPDIRENQVEWPEYSGNAVFPVPCPDMTPRDAYLELREGAHWNPDHPYGAARLRFLDWLIERTAP